MSNKTAYTYTVLRYVHDIATGEFLNVGVALLATERHYVNALCRTTVAGVAQARHFGNERGKVGGGDFCGRRLIRTAGRW